MANVVIVPNWKVKLIKIFKDYKIIFLNFLYSIIGLCLALGFLRIKDDGKAALYSLNDYSIVSLFLLDSAKTIYDRINIFYYIYLNSD